MLVDVVVNAEGLLISALIFAIIVQALSSWFAPTGMGKFSIFLHDITDPIILPLRRMIPPFGMLDLSPMIAILILIIGRQLLIGITLKLAGQ